MAKSFAAGRRIEGNLPVVPTRAALSVSNRPAAPSTIPRGETQGRFFSKSRPAAAPRSFDNEVSRMRQSIQRSGAEHAFARSGEPGQNSANSGGHGPFARPTPGVRTNSSAMQAERGATSRDNQGFQRFGSGPAQNRSRGQSVQTQGGARGTMSSPAVNGATSRPSTSDGSGWRKFSNSPPAQLPAGMSRRPTERSLPSGMSNVPRPGNSPRPEASTNGGDWRHFTPQSGGSPDRMNNRMNTGGGMNGGRGADSPARYEMSRPQMESVGGRSMGQPASRGYSRPPLEMRQPIVMPRGGEGRGSAPRMSAPSHGGGGGGGGNRGGSGGGGSHGGGPARWRRPALNPDVHFHPDGAAASRWMPLFFCATLPPWRSRFSENHALDSGSYAVGHVRRRGQGILARPVGDTETSDCFHGIGGADLVGMGRAPSPRNCDRGAGPFRVRIRGDRASGLCRVVVPRQEIAHLADSSMITHDDDARIGLN